MVKLMMMMNLKDKLNKRARKKRDESKKKQIKMEMETKKVKGEMIEKHCELKGELEDDERKDKEMAKLLLQG